MYTCVYDITVGMEMCDMLYAGLAQCLHLQLTFVNRLYIPGSLPSDLLQHAWKVTVVLFFAS